MKQYDRETLIAAEHLNNTLRKRRMEEQAAKLIKKHVVHHFNRELRRRGINWLRLR